MMRIYLNSSKHLLKLLVGTCSLLSACSFEGPEGEAGSSMEQLQVAESFNYETLQEVKVELSLGHRAAAMLFEIRDGEQTVFRGRTDEKGMFSGQLSLPFSREELLLSTYQPGFPQALPLEVEAGEVHYSYPEPSQPTSRAATYRKQKAIEPVGSYYALGGWNGLGVPDYLTTSDEIDQSLLADISLSLPETQPVPQYNPQYLVDEQMNTRLKDNADVWITFVHEGAGWKNALGFYTYDIDNPPASPDEIDSLFLIFPNTSFRGSGGGLKSGDKVYLGRFAANTGIGWFLVPNGWNGNTVDDSGQTKFSVKDFNTFTEPEYRQHIILLKDEERELILMGMEDTSRPAGDNDFNDAIFYVSANPFQAIETTELVEVKRNIDSDGDGLLDSNDEFPQDASRAYRSYAPSDQEYYSLAFEDQWPGRGDYDFNDLVTDCRFEFIHNAANEVVEMAIDLKVRAIGGYYHNGLGFELNIAPELIAQINGQRLTEGYVNTLASGAEVGQSKAVIIAFENAHALLELPFESGLVNAVSSEFYVDPGELRLSVTFTEALDLQRLGTLPYNPFMIANKQRGVEIHLAGNAPTDLADPELFGIDDDDSRPGEQRYYKTANNLPWALVLPVSFDYPQENKDITQTHLHFTNWCESSGTEKPDWYENKSGYRQSNNIYRLITE